MKIPPPLKNGIITGFAFFLTVAILSVGYATWNTMDQVITGSPLSATAWNALVNNIDYLNNTVTFTSYVTPLPSSPGIITVAHGLTTTPSKVELQIICISPDLGYSVGDTLFIVAESDGTPIDLFANPTGVGIVMSNVTTGFRAHNKSNYVWSNLTPANWKYRFRITQ